MGDYVNDMNENWGILFKKKKNQKYEEIIRTSRRGREHESGLSFKESWFCMASISSVFCSVHVLLGAIPNDTLLKLCIVYNACIYSK